MSRSPRRFPMRWVVRCLLSVGLLFVISSTSPRGVHAWYPLTNFMDVVADSLGPGCWEDQLGCYIEIPSAYYVPSSAKVFRHIYVTQSVLDGYDESHVGWDQDDFASLQQAIWDTSGTNFPLVWRYFMLEDRAAADDSVNFILKSGTSEHTYTELNLWLYHHLDVNQPATACSVYHYPEDVPGGIACQNNLNGFVSKFGDPGDPQGLVDPSLACGRLSGLSHELQHIAYNANHIGGDYRLKIPGAAEILSTAAEYVAGNRWDGLNQGSRQYWGSLHTPYLNGWPYYLFRLFSAYLFGHFGGSNQSIEDDLVYKWIRYHEVIDFVDERPASLYSLGKVLEADSLLGPLVPGNDWMEKTQNLYHRFALARWANMAEGPYGFGTSGVTPDHLGYFTWPDHATPRVESIPPVILIGSGYDDNHQETVSTWTDPMDSTSRQLSVGLYGSEYVTFLADSTFFEETRDRVLSVRFETLTLPFSNEAYKIGYCAYDKADSALNLIEPVAVVENIPVGMNDGYLDTRVHIDHFGGSGRKGITFVVSGVQGLDTPYYLGERYRSLRVTFGLEYVSGDTIVVGQDQLLLQTALDSAEEGDVVKVVYPKVWTENIAVPLGVKVVNGCSPGQWPVLYGAGTDPVVQFPADANAHTTLEGFRIVASDSTEILVALRGQGELRNCVLESDGKAPSWGVVADTSSGEIANCTISLIDGGPGHPSDGIWLKSGSTRVHNCTIDTRNGSSQSDGIVADEDSDAEILSCLVHAVDYGIKAGGSTHVKFCTVDSTHFEGIMSDNDAVVENSIVTNVLFDDPPNILLPGIAGGSAYYCIAPNGIGVPAGHGGGNSTDDPLYCGPAAHTLRVDSYGSPYNNGSEEVIGAFPVACMADTLVRNSTYSGGSLDMRGHVTIPAGRTLTLGAGTTVTVDTTSVPGSGKPEIRVMGTLQVNGSQSQRAQIRSSSKEPGSWGGIRTQYSDAHIVLNYVDMYDVETGFTDIGGQIDSLYVAHCQFGNFTNAAIFLDGSGYGGLVRLLNASVHMEGAPYGIWIDPWAESYGVDFDSVTVTGDAHGEYGVVLNTEAPASDPSFEVNSLGISGLTMGTGFSGGMVCPTIYGGEITGCKTGVSASYAGSVSLSGGGSSPFEITGCTTGLYLAGSATATVDDIVIGDIPSGGIGLYTDYSSGGTFTDVSIIGGATGFKSYGTGTQTYRSGDITGFATYGVLVAVASPVDLGVNDSSNGNNNIHSTSSSAKYVYAKNHLSELGPVKAEWNWWGTYPPSSTRFTTTTVDYEPARQDSVPPQRQLMRIVEFPAVLGLDVSPNPSSGGVILRADIPRDVKEVAVEIFDVTGRRVRSLAPGVLGVGRHEFSWDGRDDRGSRVPQGLYFVRLRAGDATRRAKILRVQ